MRKNLIHKFLNLRGYINNITKTLALDVDGFGVDHSLYSNYIFLARVCLYYQIQPRSNQHNSNNFLNNNLGGEFFFEEAWG